MSAQQPSPSYDELVVRVAQLTGLPKLRSKVFGSMRTTTGAERFGAILSYIATAARQGIDTFDALIQTVTGNPWISAPA